MGRTCGLRIFLAIFSLRFLKGLFFKTTAVLVGVPSCPVPEQRYAVEHDADGSA